MNHGLRNEHVSFSSVHMLKWRFAHVILERADGWKKMQCYSYCFPLAFTRRLLIKTHSRLCKHEKFITLPFPYLSSG